jgi:hypothetical protein
MRKSKQKNKKTKKTKKAWLAPGKQEAKHLHE